MSEEERLRGSSERVPIKRIDKYIWEIPKGYKPGMRVPGRIYADETLLEKMKSDLTIEQCANVAHLPGIYKWSITLPDGHEGYGFPIGGVAATDYEQGVLSPGGVGYDINCLTGDSLVITELGYRLPIRDMERLWQRESVRCVGSRSLKSARIAAFLRQPNDKRAYRIRTELRYEIIATEDHPFLTPMGMIPLSKLQLKERVAVHGFEGVPYEAPVDFAVISERLILQLRIHANNQAIAEELRVRGLLPLRSTSPKLPYLLKIFGYLLGDGSLIFTRKSVDLWFWGKSEDLENIREDIRRLGYSASQVYSRTRAARVTSRYGSKRFESTEYGFHVHARSLAALLVALGAPIGAKAKQDYRLPRWIFRLPLWQKRLFLGAFFGAELSTPAPVSGLPKTIAAPLLTQSKHTGAIAGGLAFIRQIRRMLSEFGVKCNSITIDREMNITRAGTISSRIRLQISESPENLIRFWGTVGFEYNQQKAHLGAVAVNYLKMKKLVVQVREQIAATAMHLRGTGLSTTEVFKRLQGTAANERFLERSIYEPRRTSPRIPEDFPTFEEYAKQVTADLGRSGSVWDEIVAVEPVQLDEPVYDFTVADAGHNFIANGFVVSNCGVRLLKTNLKEEDVRPVLSRLLDILFNLIPSGLGSRGQIRVSQIELDKVVSDGVDWAISRGYGWSEDSETCEENGCMEEADPSKVSSTAKNRGSPQLGSLGSGNHFLEVEKVDKILNPIAAKRFGIEYEGQVLVFIHTGSRGFGHQVCSDYLRVMERAVHKYNIALPDRELACAPTNSMEAEDYFPAMAAACNYAWANRQMITHWTRQAFEKIYGSSADSLGMNLIYDVAHNIAKVEEHEVDGGRRKVYIHRKGATRAFPPGHSAVPAEYREIGQPVLIPGSMGTSSWVLLGTPRAMEISFGSTAHGAGRYLSRSAAKRKFWGSDVKRELEQKGISVRAASMAVVSEEAPGAYKDVDRVAEVSHELGIATRVARLVPIGVSKG